MYDFKISKNLLYTSSSLYNYLKTVKKLDKVDEEILATITYKIAFRRLKGDDCLISFPYNPRKETELIKTIVFRAEEIGVHIKKFIEQNSIIDSMLVTPMSNGQMRVRPLQIKFLGKGEFREVTDDKVIEFLKKISNFSRNRVTLILVLDGTVKIRRLENISDWLKENDFPFEEVVLINPDHKTGDMLFFQLKPSGDNLLSMKFSREEMMQGI